MLKLFLAVAVFVCLFVFNMLFYLKSGNSLFKFNSWWLPAKTKLIIRLASSLGIPPPPPHTHTALPPPPLLSLNFNQTLFCQCVCVLLTHTHPKEELFKFHSIPSPKTEQGAKSSGVSTPPPPPPPLAPPSPPPPPFFFFFFFKLHANST